MAVANVFKILSANFIVAATITPPPAYYEIKINFHKLKINCAFNLEKCSKEDERVVAVKESKLSNAFTIFDSDGQHRKENCKYTYFIKIII